MKMRQRIINIYLPHQVMAKSKIARREETRLASEQRPEDDEDNVPVPPDGGYGWVVVFASFVCNMVVDGISYCFGIFLTDLVVYYDASKGTTAWVGSILTGSTMCVGPIVSALANKYGCRTACIAGSIIASAAFALSIFCPSVTSLMFVYGFVGGIGFGLIYLPAVVCVGYYFESKRSLATGISVCGSGFGTFAFAPLATYLLENFGWRNANLCFAAIILSCALFGALMKPIQTEKVESINEVTTTMPKAYSKSQFPRSNTSEGPIASTAVYNSSLSLRIRKGNIIQPMSRKDIFYSGSIMNLKEFQSQGTLNSYRQSVQNISRPESKQSCLGDTLGDLLDVSLLKDPLFMVLGISNIFGMGALYIPFVYLVECAKADGIEAGSASFLISLIGIVNTVSRICFGYIADSPKVNSFLVNNLCLVVAAISVSLAPFCHTYTTYVLMSVGFAVSISGYISLTSIILVDLLGLDKLTNAFGLIILFRGFAAFIGSPMAGALYDATHSYDVPFFVAGGLFALSAVISFSVTCFKRKKTDVDNDEALAPMNT